MSFSRAVLSGNVLEIYDYEHSVSPRRKEREKRKAKVDRRYSGDVTYRCGNFHARRRSFERLVRANFVRNSSVTLVTLTHHEVVTLTSAYGNLLFFWRHLRKVAGNDLCYIAVPEFQKRGAIHFHLLIWGLPSFFLDERRNRTLQHLWQVGFVDCHPTDGNPRLISYLTKYMSKSLRDVRLRGQRAFSCSRNALRPVFFSSAFQIGFLSESTGVDLSTVAPILDRRYDTHWLGAARYRLYQFNSDPHDAHS